jgi:hypothetical protein
MPKQIAVNVTVRLTLEVDENTDMGDIMGQLEPDFTCVGEDVQLKAQELIDFEYDLTEVPG